MKIIILLLVGLLGHDSWHVRENAQQGLYLVSYTANIVSHLEEIQSQTEDPEVKWRLKYTIDNIYRRKLHWYMQQSWQIPNTKVGSWIEVLTKMQYVEQPMTIKEYIESEMQSKGLTPKEIVIHLDGIFKRRQK